MRPAARPSRRSALTARARSTISTLEGTNILHKAFVSVFSFLHRVQANLGLQVGIPHQLLVELGSTVEM